MFSHLIGRIILASIAIAVASGGLTACGGGGSDPPVAPAVPPTSGVYAWVLKAQGSTAALKLGLSLVHPAASRVEWVIEPASEVVTDAKVVASGTVDTAGQRVTAVEPFALIYIVGGDVRRISLRANGQIPKSQVTRAQSTSACRFVLDAIDHANPERSRFVVSTAGADGQCSTVDDARAEVRLDPMLGVVFTPLSGGAPLGFLRDPATLAPRGWILPTAVSLWAPASTFTIRSAGQPLTAVLGSSGRSVLAESSTGLSVIDFPAGEVFAEVQLATVTTTGWQKIGFDAGAFYAYRNDGAGASGNWQVLRIRRQSPAASVLSSGPGEITLASMGGSVLYLTVFGAVNNQLLSVNKAVAGSPLALESLGTTGLAAVTTSNAGVHQLWRVTGNGTGSLAYAVEFIDEAFNKLYTSPAGGFPLAVTEATTIDFNVSESRSRFLFTTGYGGRAFSGNPLVGYDALTRASTAIGTLPGNADFGNDIAYANVVTGPSLVAAGAASRSVGGEVQAAGTRVFSFNVGAADSLKFTDSQQ